MILTKELAEKLIEEQGKDIIVPDIYTEIGQNAFLDSEIISAFIPKNIIKIGQSVFLGSSIKTITFEEGSCIEEIGYYTFHLCKNLIELDLGNLLKLNLEISGVIAYGCEKLRTVKLPPNSKTSARDFLNNSFYDCPNLKKITLEVYLRNLELMRAWCNRPRPRTLADLIIDIGLKEGTVYQHRIVGEEVHFKQKKYYNDLFIRLENTPEYKLMERNLIISKSIVRFASSNREFSSKLTQELSSRRESISNWRNGKHNFSEEDLELLTSLGWKKNKKERE